MLEAFGLCNGYDHFLRHGSAEDRIGHLLFDPAVYLSHFDSADVAAIRETGVFQHYLNRIDAGDPELRTSIYFDPIWYTQRYPEVAQDVEAGKWKCALHHYLCNDTPIAFDPLESFSEVWYLQRDPGLKNAIDQRRFRNGYMHFLRFGAKELRAPTATIDLAWYAAQPRVRADLSQGRAPDSFAHWLTIGAPAGYPAFKPVAETIISPQARILFERAAQALLPIAGRFGYDFSCPSAPPISVVMVVQDSFATTLATIASLRSNTAADIELIIVDCGSTDETRFIGQYIRGVQLLRLDAEIGWSRAADAGRQLATSTFVLFLTGQAQIGPGSIDRMYTRLAGDPLIGAVGGLLLQAHGIVGSAGGIIWRDGTAHDYQHGCSALAPEVNFVRTVDFCRRDFLLVRADLLSQLGGFDHHCELGYTAIDLCLRIAQAGLYVVYDPSALITLGEVDWRGDPSGHFLNKHAALLADRAEPGGQVQVFARHTGAQPSRLLFIEDTVPLRRTGSGFVRSNDLVRVIASLGYAVTVFPINGCDRDAAQVFGDMPDGVEVMHTLALERLSAFLESRPGYYDIIWVARTHNLAHVRPILCRLTKEGVLKARIILDTEAVTPQREAIRARLLNRCFDLEALMRAMRADADICQQTVAVTPAEAETLRGYDFPKVAVVGHMIGPLSTLRPFSKRSGMLFIGAIHEADSPNFDGLCWFVDQVLPLVEAELGWETRLTIAGYAAPGIDLSRFEQHPRIALYGPAADLTPLYESHRLFIAPTRYAAGAPYKVLEAASRGLPVVATDLLGEQLGWKRSVEILLAAPTDPTTFAAHIVALNRDAALWQSIREAALLRLRVENGPEEFSAAVASVLSRSAMVPSGP